MLVGRQCRFDVYHAVVVDHRTDGRNRSRMLFRSVGDRRDGNLTPHLVFCQFTFKHVEAHLQIFGIYNVEESLARLGSTVERVLNLRHRPGDRSGNGAVSQFMLQLMQFGYCFVIATVDTCQMLEVIGCVIKMVALIALSHQDGLILKLGFLQLGTAMEDILTQGSIAQPRNDLSFLDTLPRLLYTEHDNLLRNTTIYRNLTYGFYPALIGCLITRHLQTRRGFSRPHRQRVSRLCGNLPVCFRLAGSEKAKKQKGKKAKDIILIHIV